MRFDDYQQLTERTAGKIDNLGEALANWSMGLAGEAGEVVDYLKKVIWHGHKLEEEKVVKELGDVLWYVARIAAELGVPLDYVAEQNIEKLRKRYPEGFSVERSVNRDE